MSINWHELEKIAREWTYEAGAIIRRSLESQIQIETKSNPDDLVTEVDRNIETFFLNKIQKEFPEHHFLGEEGVSHELDSLNGTVWIIDPIDGTMNFIHQKINYAISVAVYHDQVGMIGIVYDVKNDEMFHAVKDQGAFLNEQKISKGQKRDLNESILGLNGRWIVEETHPYVQPLKKLVRDVRGMRSYGSAAIEIVYVAVDRLDGYMSVNLSPWDYAAGVVIAEEMGSKATTFSGERLSLLKPCSVVVGKPQLHKDIVSTYLNV